jgi:hypothetical protein
MTPEHRLYRQLSETKIYKERFGDFKTGDIYGIKANRDDTALIRDAVCRINVIADGSCFWLPPVFDPENPERCLWGMVDWRIRTRLLVAADREIKMFGQPFDRLDIALIKAILKQEKSNLTTSTF